MYPQCFGNEILGDPVSVAQATLVDEGKLSKDEGLRQGTSSWMTILAANTIPQAKRVKEILDDAMRSGRPFELVVTTLLCCRAVQPHLEARDMPMVLLDLQPGFRPNYHHLPGRSWAYTGALLRSRVSWWFRVLSWSFHQQVVWNSMLNKYANECRVMAGLETLTSYHDYCNGTERSNSYEMNRVTPTVIWLLFDTLHIRQPPTSVLDWYGIDLMRVSSCACACACAQGMGSKSLLMRVSFSVPHHILSTCDA